MTPGIRCPECDTTLSDVVQTRQRVGFIARRRVCFNGHKFTTHETVPVSKTVNERKGSPDGR